MIYIEDQILNRSLSAGDLVNRLRERPQFSSLLDLDSFNAFAVRYDGEDIYDYLEIVEIYTAFISSRKKDAIILSTAPLSTNQNRLGRKVLNELAKEEYASYPVYIETFKGYCTIYDSGVEKSSIVFLRSLSKYQTPSEIFQRYLVRVTEDSYKYGKSIKYYICNGFDEANDHLMKLFNEQKKHYTRFQILPNEKSNEWFADDGRLNDIHIEIIDLSTSELAYCPIGLA